MYAFLSSFHILRRKSVLALITLIEFAILIGLSGCELFPAWKTPFDLADENQDEDGDDDATDYPLPDDDTDSSDGGAGGPLALPVFSLPFPYGDVHRCTQGVNGDYSHRGTSTRYGIDLDTPNNSNGIIYAPVSGIAYVHEEDPWSGFGRHVNIALPGGGYIVIGHLLEIWIGNGDPVNVRQLIGFEGRTGESTGDHVHIGLMQGNPEEDAIYGTSIPAAYRARDTTTGGSVGDIEDSDFVCGLSDGHFYESQLAIPTWHPDGLLVQVPGDADVFVLDRGEMHVIDNEQVFSSYGFDFSDVVLISPRERDCWGTGLPLVSTECYRAVRDASGTAWLAYECEDDLGRYRQPIPAVVEDQILASWGISSVASATSELGDLLLDYPTHTGSARLRDGAIVRENDYSTRYIVNEGVALPFEDDFIFTSLGLWNLPTIVIPDGTLGQAVIASGDCSTDQGCINWERAMQCGGYISADEIVDDGGTGGDPEDGMCEEDTDGDGVNDCDDNCPLHDNDQGDVDNDGLGDSCDLDVDGDGTLNADDCSMFNPAIGECPPEDDPAEPDPAPPGDDDDTTPISDDDDTTPPTDDDDATTPPSGDDDTTSPPADDDDTTPEEEPTPASGDDDTTEEPADDDDATVDPPDPDPTPDVSPIEPSFSILTLIYSPPSLLSPYTYIQLSGEYTLVTGGYGFLWTAGLATAVNASTITWNLPGVVSGDVFRFSLEFYDAPTGYLNWACVPTTPFSSQGTLSVSVDGVPVPFTLGTNYIGGCEDFVTIP